MTRKTVIGKDATVACDYCGTEVKYHVADSDFPLANDLKKINQHRRLPILKSTQNIGELRVRRREITKEQRRILRGQVQI